MPLRFHDVSWFNSRSRSHTLAPLGWEEVRVRASMLLPHLRRDWAHSCHIWLSLERPCRIHFRGCAWQMCARDAPALSAHAELEASFKNELAQLESQVDGLQKCAPPFRPHTCAGSICAAAAAGSALLCGRYKAFMQNSLVQHDLRTSSLEELVHPTQSQRRCGRGGPSPGADVAGVSPVPVQMWERWALRCRGACRCRLPHTLRMRGRATESAAGLFAVRVV